MKSAPGVKTTIGILNKLKYHKKQSFVVVVRTTFHQKCSASVRTQRLTLNLILISDPLDDWWNLSWAETSVAVCFLVTIWGDLCELVNQDIVLNSLCGLKRFFSINGLITTNGQVFFRQFEAIWGWNFVSREVTVSQTWCFVEDGVYSLIDGLGLVDKVQKKRFEAGAVCNQAHDELDVECGQPVAVNKPQFLLQFPRIGKMNKFEPKQNYNGSNLSLFSISRNYRKKWFLK